MTFVENERYISPPFYNKNPENESKIYGPIYFRPMHTLFSEEVFSSSFLKYL